MSHDVIYIKWASSHKISVIVWSLSSKLPGYPENETKTTSLNK